MSNQKNQKTLKELMSQLQVLEGDLEADKVALTNIQHKMRLKQSSAQSLRDKIKKLENPVVPQVSEHALYRYYERVLGVNYDGIRAEILNDKAVAMLQACGGTLKYRNPEKGYIVVFKNNMALTIDSI
jgi:predicted  nucleic acid-binding Zn-ribbon protein